MIDMTRPGWDLLLAAEVADLDHRLAVADLLRAVRDQSRAEAREEAARVCDEEAATLPDLPTLHGDRQPGSIKARVMRLAARIRAGGGK